MEYGTAAEVVLILAIMGFTAWLSRLSYILGSSIENISDTDAQLDEIKEGIEIVATILNKLPELMPQFNMNTNPLQPIFEAFAQKLSGAQPLMTYNAPRDDEGKFSGTPEEQEKNTP